MEHATILVTLVCNLRCKLCSAFAPYYTDSKHPAASQNIASLDRFFSLVSYVNKFTICGGEPMTYPYLTEIVDHLNEKHDRIGLLEILTNSTVVPSEQLLESIHRYNGKFRILSDDYGKDLSRNADSVEKAFVQAGISCERRNYTSENPHCGGWVDFGDLTQKKFHSQEEIYKHFEKCAYPNKLGFSFAIGPDGCMFPCGPARRCHKLGSVNNYDDYIDLFDDSLSVESQRQKLIRILNGKCLEACAYCNGMCEDSQRFAPAEQLKR